MNLSKFQARFFATAVLVCGILISGASAQRQQAPAAPRATPTPTLLINPDTRPMPVAQGNNLYCAGFIQSAPIDTSYEIVGAPDERDKHIFSEGDVLYISAGANKNVKVGDTFSVVRPRGQVEGRPSRKRNLGFYVAEVGSVEVLRVKPEVSVVRVKTSCDNFLLGDLLEPSSRREAPQFQSNRPALDLFGESSGKASGRIIMARDGRELLGREQIVYIDLGAEDSVKVGDYLTIYRPLGEGNIFSDIKPESVAARNENYESRRYKGGRFSNQAPRKSGSEARGETVKSDEARSRRPAGLREVVGEIVILNVKEKTATAVITRTATEVHPGDNVEIQ